MSSDTYRVYAVRYAHHHRRSSENFLGGDPHDVPMPLDYFVWAIVGEVRTVILDTGFDAHMARKRGREFLRPPRDGLLAIGVDPASVQDVVISHMHYDHAGNHDLFPNATYHLQDREMAFCTGRCMCHAQLRRSFAPEDVSAMVRRLFAGRMRFHDGAGEVAPGITVHHVGGHIAGIAGDAGQDRAAGSCSPPTPRISMRISSRCAPTRRSTTSATCSKASPN
jgi:glyoxylase-like metal-dependent hydrolase (beta-lactamase superfamily II)